MYGRLPREIRNMIYAHIWDKKYLESEGYSWMDSYITSNDIETLGILERFPHVIKPHFVGPEVAHEIVKEWYSAHSLQLRWDFTEGRLNKVITRDFFNVGFRPATALRKLELCFDIENFALGEIDSQSNNATSRRKALCTTLQDYQEVWVRTEDHALRVSSQAQSLTEVLRISAANTHEVRKRPRACIHKGCHEGRQMVGTSYYAGYYGSRQEL
jgi:hypothetical protein